MHDTTLLQLIVDDIGPAEQLLELIQAESLALHGRDMPRLEELLAQKHSLVVQLEQHGRKRSQLLVGLNLSADQKGLHALAAQSTVGEQMLAQSERLNGILSACRAANEQNGRLIRLHQMATANQLRILNGGETPSLYNSRGSTANSFRQRPLSQA